MRTLRQTIARRDQAAAVARYIDRTVVGTPVEVTNVLAAARATGRLVSATAPRPMPTGDPRVAVTVRVLDPTPVPVRRVSRRRLSRPATAALVVTAVLPVLIGLVYAVVVLVQTVIALIPAILAGLFLLTALWFVLGRAGACPGIHCPGCGCR